jgi:hypothetical protein
MPTRKQRRRRQKERRHEYEFVYVDEEGQEVEVDEGEVADEGSRRNGRGETKRPSQKPKAAAARSIRPVPPPSWRRVGKRALIFCPLIFLAFSFVNAGQSVGGRLAVTFVYTAFFVPFMYLMDRAMYRSYLRRTGQEPPQRRPRRR